MVWLISHHLAAPRTVQDEPDRNADHDSNGDHEKVVGDVEEWPKLNIAEQRIGFRDEQRRDTPDQLHHIFEDQENAIGDENDDNVVAVVKVT